MSTPRAADVRAAAPRVPRAMRALLARLDANLVGARVRFENEYTGGEGAGLAVEVGPADGREVFVVRVRDQRFYGRVIAWGNLGLGEAYMDGQFSLAPHSGRLEDLLTAMARSRLDEILARDVRLVAGAAALRLRDAWRGSWRNVQKHYDVGDDLFECFLDRSLAYSCGYAKSPDDDVDALQENKYDRICRKLRLAPGERLLDIGCGFGGLLVHAARHHGVFAQGITTSRRHHALGSGRVARAGLSDRVRIELRDHKSLAAEAPGSFDKVVSVGMMEHLPRREYGRYFAAYARLLKPQGLALVHTIGCNAARNVHDPFTQKYIFPGSNQPRLSEIARAIEEKGMLLWDVENMARHYAVTAARWLDRFRKACESGALDAARYDTRFRRMWEYYLCCCIAAARATDSALYQVLFGRDRAASVPLQRV